MTVSVAHANMRDIPSINGSAVAVVDKGDQLEHWGGSVYDPSDGSYMVRSVDKRWEVRMD